MEHQEIGAGSALLSELKGLAAPVEHRVDDLLSFDQFERVDKLFGAGRQLANLGRDDHFFRVSRLRNTFLIVFDLFTAVPTAFNFFSTFAATHLFSSPIVRLS